ncbi:hypothetical protein [Xylophilus sp.]|uniref:hypothetical protein n=1 Tax=Xylophilus sp. TaxID=2653893 RepID=UPI0013BE1815|nr:hypothetical protein [Xylophilus sp.]KAF1049762.1 MAG: hypothetical protein GAK38_00425 [Xylophilus sp.]
MIISPNARDSLERMAVQGLRDAFARPDGGLPDVARVDDPGQGAGSHMVVLMIVSNHLRLVMALHVPDTAASRAYFVPQGLPAGTAAERDRVFRDALSERGNMCCGMVNRALGRFFRHTGMSTPHTIDSRSGPHLRALPHQHLAHFELAAGDAVIVRASLCVDAHEPLDFDWHDEAPAETAGELELF